MSVTPATQAALAYVINEVPLSNEEVLGLILALWDAERVNQSDFPHTARSYRRIRVKLDAVIDQSGYLESLRK